MRAGRTLLLAALAWLAPLAGAQAQLVGQSTPTQMTYALGSFKRIVLAGAADVRLVQGEANQLVIEGDAEVQKRVEVDLSGNSLRIEPAGGWKFWNSRRTLVLITARDLEEINIQGAGDVIADGPLRLEQLTAKITGSGNLRLTELQARRLAMHIVGSGDAKVTGTVQDLQLSISGTGDFIGQRLRSERAKVSIAGVGDVSLWVTEDLVARLSGAGSVRYWGNPHVQKSISGVGSVTPAGERGQP